MDSLDTHIPSPSERYAAARRRSQSKKLIEFQSRYQFPFDEFQNDACRILEDGHGVLVAAPTGSGKTLVGEFAAYLALTSSRRCFYTTPIKALSNQKYLDLQALFGESNVGLVTGDTNINSEAPIIVMTTEVLRNMLYASPQSLHDLAYVVMDEVHYLADRFRGAVWEEVLIHLPDSVQIVSLSATVSNAEEFGDWLRTIRGSTEVVLTEVRPVPLYQHVLFGNRLLDLFDEDGRVNPEILQLERESVRRARTGFGKTGKGHRPNSIRENPEVFFSPARQIPRPDVIAKLQRENLLPAITFIFSRNACTAAVKQCVDEGLWLTNKEERSQIREIVHQKTSHIPEEDLNVLGFHEWQYSLERGFAAHHAGLLPAFKEAIEALFQKGLVKAVFATETLALGINMPARTVVLEKLSKWNGEAHVMITPGEYTQLCGRAGRRGIDIEGNSVVVWNRETDSASLAGLASTRTYPLKSSFKPTYNMTINLLSGLGSERARSSLQASFAQFQADKAVVGLAKQISKNESAISEFHEAVTCHMGDFAAYADIKEELRDLERNLSKLPRSKRRQAEIRIQDLRVALRQHPCHSCHDRDSHLRIYERGARLVRENRSLQERVDARTNVIVRRFDLIQILLRELGYLDGETITPHGRLLAKIYSETDLLVAEMVRNGDFIGLTAQELVSVISALVFEARKDESPKIPQGRISEVLKTMVMRWSDINDRELELHLEEMRQPDLGFAFIALRWAQGNSLSSVLKGTEITVGDFIRTMKQIVDLLRQIGNASPDMKDICELALNKIDRGIITYAGVVG